MSGSYHRVSPAISESHDQINIASSPAKPEYYALDDISKACDSKTSSTQVGQGWGQEEATTTNPLGSGFHDENHTNEQRGQPNLRPPDDTLEDLEIHLPVLNDKELRSLDKEWHSSTQLRKLLFKGFTKWLATGVFVAVIYCVLYIFSKKPVMTNWNKKAFNVLITGSTLALGLNIASSLKAMAVDFRWWLLSHRKRPLKEVNLILHLDSLTEVIKLAWATPRLSLLCLMWLALNIVAQLGLAILGLTYSVDSQSGIATTTNGTVQTPDLSQIYPELNNTANLGNIGAQQYAANNFGVIALGYFNNSTDYTSIPSPETVWTPASDIIFESNDFESWQTVVLDLSSDYQVAIFTNRIISSAWHCDSNIVLDGGNGSSHDLTVLLNTNGSTTSKYIPITSGLNQTTFMTDPDNNNCGPGCSTVEAFEASATQAWWYTCNITITNATNAKRPEHFVGQNFAKMAASAIALQGYRTTGQNTTQYQYYPAESFYGSPASGDSDLMGNNIGLFAIGVVATAVQWNPLLSVPGDEPNQGVALSVDWTYVHLILIFTLAGQFFFFIVSCLISNMVVVKDDSAISVARLLRPIVERLGNAGSTASGEEICEVLTNAEEGLGKVGYTVVHPVVGRRHHLVLGDHKMLRAFPSGYYN